MPRLQDFIRVENTSADPIVVGDTRVTPQAQAFGDALPLRRLRVESPQLPCWSNATI